MKSGSRVSGWGSWVGVLGVAVLALGLSLKLEGAPTPSRAGQSGDKAAQGVARETTTAKVESLSRSEVAPAVPEADASRVRTGTVPTGDLKVMNVVHVDWRDDRGTRDREAGKLFGPVPSRWDVGGVATVLRPVCTPPACSFAIECDDGNGCTIDRCDIPPGQGACAGLCAYDPVANGSAGECDNDIFCDGKETCQGAVCDANSPNQGTPCDSHLDCGVQGTCLTGTCNTGNVGKACNEDDDCNLPGPGQCTPGTCTDGPTPLCCPGPTPTSCSETMPRCSGDSTNKGAVCTSNTDCTGGGTCERCQPDCANGTCTGSPLKCVGGTRDGQTCTVDTDCSGCDDGVNCNGKETCVNNRCVPGVNPCGLAADCFEGQCSAPQNPPKPECNSNDDCDPGTCVTTVEFCKPGRCCRPFTDDNGESQPGCKHNKLSACTPDNAQSQWYPGDGGSLLASDQVLKCGGADPRSQVTDAWGCPKYGRGITMHAVTGQPVYPVKVGPVSNSPIGVPLPNGPGIQLYQLGDDYAFPANTDGKKHLGLDVIRWAGGPVGANRISMDFYDSSANFIEDIILPTLGGGIGYQVVILTPALVIPNAGYVVMRAAEDFEANTELVWLSTEDTAAAIGGVGTNDANILWVNKGPTANFLDDLTPGIPGILAMELVGDSVDEPVGACVEESTGACQDGVLLWVCRNDPTKVYMGDTTQCMSCNAGQRTGKGCRTCSVGTCTTDDACDVTGICTDSQCTQGKVGQSCLSAADCKVEGRCSGTCSGGTVPAGTACTQSNSLCTGNGQPYTCCTATGQGTCTADCGEGGICVKTAGVCLCSATSDCLSGVCNPNHAKCNGPNICYYNGVPDPNTPCTGGGAGDCPAGPTPIVCGPPQCVTPDEFALGACCNLSTGGCTETSSGACTGDFQGLGTKCDADRGAGDEGQQHCCPQPQALQCMSGPNNLQTCTTHSDCGRCTGRCSNDGDVPCANNADCDAPGTCLALNLGDPCAADGTCSGGKNCIVGQVNTSCVTSTNCDVAGVCGIGGGLCDIGGTDKCTAGTVGASCTANSDCDACTAGTVGVHCTAHAECDLAGVCADENGLCSTDDKCVGGLRNGLECVTDLDCQGSVCDGRCVSRWSGADDCEDAFIHVISVPNVGDPPVVVTITGSNVSASSTFAHPDPWWGASLDANAEPGWWESFSFNACARLRLDHCCSDPVRQPQWAFITDSCASDSAIIGNAPDPAVIGQAPNFRGPPYCPLEDNLWQTFGLVNAGTYHFAQFSELQGAHGQYQVHITIDACPVAACCYLECSGSATLCTTAAHCPEGQTCDSKCAEKNQKECDALLGFALQPPQVGAGVPQCIVATGGVCNNPGTLLCTAGNIGFPCEVDDDCNGDVTCSKGSCCTGPGVCIDAKVPVPGSFQPMVKDRCEQVEGGSFVGGVRCFGGECTGGVADGHSCDAPGPQCSNEGVCEGTAAEKNQLNPCPICEVQGPFNCQAFSNTDAAFVAYSDKSFGAGAAVADDFIHSSGDISTVCVWGSYVHLDPDEGTSYDCGSTVGSDSFRVRIYKDKGCGADCYSIPDSSCAYDSVTCPGGFVERSGAQVTMVKKVQDQITALAGIGTGIKVYGYQLTLDPPISGLTPSGCYWLEVVNNTPDSSTTKMCEWGWLRTEPGAPSGNRYAASGNAFEGYVPGSEVHWDQAFCLNTSFAAGGCGDRQKACCSCGAQCGVTALEACMEEDATWVVTEPDCVGFSCSGAPANDDCADATEVAVGTFVFNTGCASNDGANPVTTDFGTSNLEKDLWYFFTVPNNPDIPDDEEDCDLLASMCGTGSAAGESALFDSMLAIYHDTGRPGTCPCPTTVAIQEATKVDANGEAAGWAVDENCFKEAVGGPGFGLFKGAKPGECYTIRVGGFPGGDNAGSGNIDISCGPTFCGDGRTNGAEQCDGLDTSRCPTAGQICNSDCTCGAVAVCGDGIITPPREECDTTGGCVNPATCNPAAGDPSDDCICAAFCGNNNIEQGEDCDSAQDTACPGLCGVGADPCLCPPFVCGNGLIEPGEDCDPTADPNGCDGGPCRPAGDPLGGCTCACEAVIEPTAPTPVWRPATGWPNTDPEATTRTLRFKVTAPVTATGSPGQSALKVTMINLQDPVPANLPSRPPPDFSTYESATCTAAGEANGCARWVGKPGTFLEAQDNPTGASNRAARLQCTPFYYDWVTETATSPIAVVGAEIAPSSEYRVEAYAVTCKGVETGCADKSGPVTMYTRRSGDAEVPFNPPATSAQPDVTDIAQLVNKFKNVAGAPVKSISQLQPNLPELNADVGALDIVAVVDAVKQFAYAFGGPCACPSAVTCGSTTCTSATVCINLIGPSATCMKTCSGGDNAGDTCINNTHCPGGTCGAGFCRDKCGRCTPP